MASTPIPVRGSWWDITADLILAAAARTGRPLARGDYMNHDDPDCPVCAVGALAMDIEPRLIDFDFAYARGTPDAWDYVKRAYCLAGDDERMLSAGFEGWHYEPKAESERHLFAVGSEVARRAGLVPLLLEPIPGA